MKLFSSLCSCLLFSLSIIAQNQLGTGSIKGSVVDATLKESLPYTTVVLLDAEKKLIEGVITNEKGEFMFSNISKGTYSIEIQYIGFQKFEKSILLNTNNEELNLGVLELKEAANTLDEVVVQGETAAVSLKLGKKVFRVSKDITSQNGSAIDALNNVPSVNVSPTGAISLRGNTNVHVMINGRRSGLTQSQALEQLSADIIESIEVITNPSAKFDASGSSGIINIVLKKNRQSGLNGQVRLVAGTPDDFRAIGNLNYKTEKFNFFTNLGIRYTDYEGEYFKEQSTTSNGVETFFEQNEDENRHDDGKFYYIGTDYYMNDKNSLTMAYYRNETEDTDLTNLNFDFLDNAIRTQSLLTVGNSKEKRDYNQIETNYTKTFDKKGRKLTVDFQYDFWNSNKKWNLNTNETFPSTTNISTIRTEGKVKTNDIVLQSDYKTPLSKNSNLEIGAKLENRNISNEFLAEEFVNETFEIIDDIANDLDYKENIVAGYTQYNNKHKKFNYQIGLRIEHTNINIEDTNSILNINNNYTNLFPSATIGYEIKENLNTQLSYSKRIRRPSLWELSPFFELKDFTARFTGNPTLNPSYTDALELSLIYRKNKFQLNPSVYYSSTKDVLQYLTIKNEQDVFVESPINLDRENRYGFEISSSYSPLKWLRLMADFNFYTYEQTGQLSSEKVNISDKTWFVNFTASVKPIKTMQIQTRIYHEGRKLNAQRLTLPITYANIAISKSLFKNKGSIVFNISNPFDSARSREEISGSDFYINQNRSRNAQRYSLSFVYKFNQKKSDKNRSAQRSNRN